VAEERRASDYAQRAPASLDRDHHDAVVKEDLCEADI
jgi:hypothetical protein